MTAKAYIVTEREQHRILLREVLQPHLTEEVHIAVGGNWSSAESLARTIAVEQQVPVALIVGVLKNRDDEEPFLWSSLREVSGERPYHVGIVSPQVERLLFVDETVAEAVIGRTLTDTERGVSLMNPEHILAEALRPPAPPSSEQDRYLTWLLEDFVSQALAERLPHLDLRSIREQPEIVALRQFLKEAVQPVLAVAV
jgi:hypothetical protein